MTRPEPEPIAVDTDVDALPPKEIAEKTADTGVEKGTSETGKLIILGMLAGVYIGLGGLFATVAGAGAAETMAFGATQVLMGIVFSLGLLLVLIGGAELFTGNVLLLVALAEKRLTRLQLARAWAIVYAANLVGSLALAVLVLAAGLHSAGDGAVGVKAIEMAGAKTRLGFGTAVASGVIANGLVCLGVWLFFGARTITDKVLAVVPPIAAFVAVGTEHSIANMYLIPYALLLTNFAAGDLAQQAVTIDPTLRLSGFIGNLIPVTIGNIIGGALIGLAYWAAYLRR